MDLSVIIPSFKRADLLQYGLKSWALQNIKSSYEIIVLNDGIEDETAKVCSNYQSRLPINYVFTGQRNAKDIVWRIPGFAINIGAQLAKGKNIIIACPEIYILNDCVQHMIDTLNEDPKKLVITYGKDDRGAAFLKYVKEGLSNNDIASKYDSDVKNTPAINTEFPFFMGINRKEFIDIGGYDEDFIGYCFDDADVVNRLRKNGCSIHKIASKIIHLYHPRLRYGLEEVKEKWNYNEKLYYERINQIQRNVGRQWGVICA
jgi:glycosyltransferase involved in cell wall biosynthesis